MQKLKNFNWKNFFLQGILPFALAITAAFIARYQLELSDGVTPDFLAMQWPLYAPLNALTAFCLTLVLFAILGKWSRATGISGALFTVIALINYYTRDLHGSALMPQDILNLGTAAEVMGSYTLQITATVRTIARINRSLGQIDELAGRIKALSNDLGENLADRVLDAAEKGADWKESLADRREDLMEDLASWKEELAEQRSEYQLDLALRRAQRLEELEQLRKSLSELLDRHTFGQRRLLRAFPQMRSIDHKQALERLRQRQKERQEKKGGSV